MKTVLGFDPLEADLSSWRASPCATLVSPPFAHIPVDGYPLTCDDLDTELGKMNVFERSVALPSTSGKADSRN